MVTDQRARAARHTGKRIDGRYAAVMSAKRGDAVLWDLEREVFI
ncbi:MAG: hypothetical protein ACLPUG_10940 [Acidimicrobiales bacterium]